MYPFTELPTVFKKNYSVYFTRIHKKAVVSGFKSYIFNFMLLWLYMTHLKYLLKVYSVHSDILGNGTFRCEYFKPFSQGAHNGIGYSEYGVISIIMETCLLYKSVYCTRISGEGLLQKCSEALDRVVIGVCGERGEKSKWAWRERQMPDHGRFHGPTLGFTLQMIRSQRKDDSKLPGVL